MAETPEIELLRPADLLVAQVQLHNLELTERSLVRAVPGEPASVILILPPQHFREPAATAPTFSGATPIAAGAPSKFEFVVPEDVDELEIPATGLLGLCEELGVAPTYPLWVPARSFLRPVDGRWTLGLVPVEHAGRTDLWRAKMIGPSSDGRLAARFELAIVDHASSAPDWQVTPSQHDLLTRYRSGVFVAHRFELSTFGTSMRLRGPIGYGEDVSVTPESEPNLNTYEHDVDFGRDTRVQVLTHGHLSSGHPATRVELVRRVFHVKPPDGSEYDDRSVAWLHRQTTIVVTDPVVPLDQLAAVYPRGGREVPFRKLRMVTEETPPLDEGSAQQAGPFRVRTPQGNDFLFDMVGTDHDGRAVELRMPLYFIPLGAEISELDTTQEQVPTGAQRLTVAAPQGHEPGSTAVTAEWLTVSLVRPQPADPSTLPFGFGAPVLPAVEEMGVVLDAAVQFTSRREVVTARLHPSFLDYGLEAAANPLGALLDVPQPLALKFSTRDVGGLASPDMAIGAVTASKGALPKGFEQGGVPAVEELAGLFGGAKILGSIDLASVVDLGSVAEPGARAPELTRRVAADKVELRYRWKAPIRPSNGTPLIPTEGQQSDLELEATVIRRLDGDQGENTSVKGTLRQVDLEVAGVVGLHFDVLRFVTEPGVKTRIIPEGMQLAFKGELSFLNDLCSALEEAGLADKPAVDVTPSEISAGFSAAVPSLQVGMFALANLAIETRLRIPFDGSPAEFRFAVADRHRPFTLTVSVFGGGGFFALELDSRGIRRVEAALEFGGALSLDIVVASGGVYVMGGIYFLYDGGKVTASGYLRCGGHLSVLGLVTVAVDFYMQLSYQPETGKISGAASLTVGVKVLMFSKTVTLSIERQFAGSGGDPSFEDCFELEDWEEYCSAFA